MILDLLSDGQERTLSDIARTLSLAKSTAHSLLETLTTERILERDEALYIDCIESQRRLRTYSVIGVRAPLYCTSVGKAILAYLPDNEIRRVAIEHGLARFTETTITTEEQLWTVISRIRARG